MIEMMTKGRNGLLEWVAIAAADGEALPMGISVVTTFNILHDIYALFERVQ